MEMKKPTSSLDWNGHIYRYPTSFSITEQETIRETSDTNIYGLSAWCRQYHKHTAYPCTILQRFTIAHYQLSQGIKWNNTPTSYREYESFASSALHFIMVAESLELEICDDYLPEGMLDMCELETWPLNYRNLTLKMSAAAQMVFYAEKSFRTGYTRKSRYNPLVLQKLLAEIVVMLFASIPSVNRQEAVEQASSIMTKRL